MRGNSHVRCEAGEKLEIISKVYLSLFTVFGGFAPNSDTAETMSANLGDQTVMSGTVTQSKVNGSKQLQMISRPLMTVDELKTLPRFHFIIAKTGAHPMKTKLDLFMKWGISLDKKFEVDKNNVREVHYAGKDQLIAEIEKLGTGSSGGMQHTPVPNPKQRDDMDCSDKGGVHINEKSEQQHKAGQN